MTNSKNGTRKYGRHRTRYVTAEKFSKILSVRQVFTTEVSLLRIKYYIMYTYSRRNVTLQRVYYICTSNYETTVNDFIKAVEDLGEIEINPPPPRKKDY